MQRLQMFCFVLGLTIAVPTVVSTSGCSAAAAAAKKRKKAGGTKAAGAKAAGQKTGGTAAASTAKATDKGADYEGVTCNADEEGVAWCDSDTTVVFCAAGHFYVLDCVAAGANVCAEDPDTFVIDCAATGDVE